MKGSGPLLIMDGVEVEEGHTLWGLWHTTQQNGEHGKYFSYQAYKKFSAALNSCFISTINIML